MSWSAPWPAWVAGGACLSFACPRRGMSGYGGGWEGMTVARICWPGNTMRDSQGQAGTSDSRFEIRGAARLLGVRIPHPRQLHHM